MTTAPSPLTLQLTRIIKAPRSRVYAAWTDASKMEWWAPEGCETLEFTADFHPGGKWRWRMRNPEGEMAARGEYRECTPNERLVYTWQWEDDSDWENVDSVITVEFHDHPEGTELRFTHEGFPSAESLENHRRGWTDSLGNLDRKLVG